MTSEEKNGRTVLVWMIAGVLFISATVIAVYVATKGTERLPVQIVRFFLTAALMWWLYRGSLVAKWTVITLLGIAGVAGLLTILLDNRLAGKVGVKIGMAYLTIVGTLLKSSKVNAFLEHQRARGHEDDSLDS